MAQRQHEQSRAPVLATLRVAHHGPPTIIDLRFFARRSLNHHASFRSRRFPELIYEALDALIAGRKAVTIDQIRQIAIAVRPRDNPSSIASR